jgi:hypothetical protein
MYGSFYVKKLEAESAAKQAKDELARAEQSRAVTKAARERLSPLKIRVAHLLQDIPEELQQEGLSLPALQAALRGRQGRNASSAEIGVVLRRLGFRRERRWRGDDQGFRAVWRKRPSPGLAPAVDGQERRDDATDVAPNAKAALEAQFSAGAGRP